ncbi:MAG: Malate synthase A [Acidimicrobiaceae bacterium]|nr:MAG: Malate synthase A [Acidimicrobiaceae bacterium]
MRKSQRTRESEKTEIPPFEGNLFVESIPMSEIQITEHPRRDQVFTPDATDFIANLVREFRDERNELLDARKVRQADFESGLRPDFPEETKSIREDNWQVSPPPEEIADRRVEITGPTERKMMINALNSGARVFMADCEDSSTPTWENVLEGQINIRDAFRRELALETGEKKYRLNEEIATLFIRPRGWHLSEKNVVIDGLAAPASLIDFGLVIFHNAQSVIQKGNGPYFYLPKLESYKEARLWNKVFCYAQETLGIPHGSIRATVLIETILAAFEMDEILYELKDHSAGLNAGRWDYIFSVAKKFSSDPAFVLPDRSDVTMTVPFMRAYTELMVATCHKRGAHAIGGMSAFIPNRRDPEVTEEALEKVAADKSREATDGCDGTWVAHPDLVEIAIEEFNKVLQNKPNQIDRLREDVSVSAQDLLSIDQTGGAITLEGLRINVEIGLRYIASWLAGTGAAAINNLMEDAATAEISRAQVWQWVHHEKDLDNGQTVTADLVKDIIQQEIAAIEEDMGTDLFNTFPFDQARKVFEEVALADEFVDFLTLPAYEIIN